MSGFWGCRKATPFLKGGEHMYIRKTKDYWSIHSQYGVETNCSTLKEAKENLKDYRENVNYPVWIGKHREKIDK